MNILHRKRFGKGVQRFKQCVPRRRHDENF
nr:MAG TPA: hypothetical protein [Bacteriophage sp.]